MMNEKQVKYQKYCETMEEIPLFFTFDWLVATCGQDWDVVFVEKGNELFAALPYTIHRKIIFSRITQPLMTPYLGVWINYPDGQKESTRLSFEKEIMTELIDQLPPFSSFSIKFNDNNTNALPFHWKGFDISARYTYVIDKPGSSEDQFADLNQNVRRQIKKAEEELIVIETEEIKTLFHIKQLDYEEKGKSLPISATLLKNVFDLLTKKNCGQILNAVDTEGNIHASILIAWDKQYCYYLFGGSDPKYRNSGAMSLLLFEAINISSSLNLSFNFEGSMIEPIERFFRNFGAKQRLYLEVKKCNSILLKLLNKC